MKLPTTLAAITALTVLSLASLASAQLTIKTIVNNGNSSNRYDIVILGDGYKTTEQAKFDSNCTAVVNKLFATEPYKTFKFFFNVHTVFRASKDSGADHPDKSPPIYKDTVYDASYNTGGTPRCLYIKNQSQALADARKAPAVEGRVMVIVNDSRYGGCAGTFAVTYNGSSMTNVQVHEFGHSFARVADEYDYPYNTYTGSEPAQKNVTKDPTGKLKWAKWIGSRGVSAYEGARYYKKGLYRPISSCIMRNLGRPMCAVCAEQAVILGYKTVSAIDKPIPAATTVRIDPGKKQTFSFTSIAPATSNAAIVWKVDGKAQGSTSTSMTVDTTGMAPGNHAVVLEVQDQTALVRNDPGKELLSKRTWTLAINTPRLPDFYALYMPVTKTSMPAGTNLIVESWVQNLGPVASPAIQVDHFLSADTKFDTSDVYLGNYTQAALAATGAAKNVRSSVRVPAHVRPGKYYLGMVIDRKNDVKELSETNNVRWFPLNITPASCNAQLAYDDSLNYPASQGSIQASTGGTLHPVVTARCHLGHGYLILLGCTGTTPGTRLTSTVTLPLNVDACTRVFYGGVGTSLLQGFLGTIDSGGYGRAKLTVPSGIKGALTGHFAAVLFNKSNGAFTGATNPVGFTFK